MRLKQKKSSKSILSDKIADALTVKPRADIEDDHIFNTKPNTVSRTDFSSDSEDEATISAFRKQNVNLLSEISKKYEGEIVSKQQLEQSSYNSSDDISSNEEDYSEKTLSKLQSPSYDEKSDEENDYINKQPQRGAALQTKIVEESSDEDSNESIDYSIVKAQKQFENSSDDESNDNTNNSEDEEEGKDFDFSQMTEPVQENFEHFKKQNVSEEAKKGSCVRNQLLLWESLLEMRIHLQRCMNSANRMPMSDKYQELKDSNDFVEESNVAISNVANVLDKLLMLQNVLMKNFPETKGLLDTKTEIPDNTNEDNNEEIPSDTDNEEIPSDTDGEEDTTVNKKKTQNNNRNQTVPKKRKLDEYENDLSTSYKKFIPYRDATIQKWNDKTRLATATNFKTTPTNTILQQISYLLSDRNKLIRRTQLKRSEYDIIGYNNPSAVNEMEENNMEISATLKDRKDNDEYIPEIFDDSDFYHQLLRELIECKSADITDPVQLSRQWITLQQMRSKMKRKVDTKATKGRKIKYVVHNKLLNYMAPEKSLKWNDESTNELYSSLFGKIFEHNNVGINVNLENVSIN